MNMNIRFLLGLLLLGIGLLLPLGVYPVAQSNWSATVKNAVGGILFFGIFRDKLRALFVREARAVFPAINS